MTTKLPNRSRNTVHHRQSLLISIDIACLGRGHSPTDTLEIAYGEKKWGGSWIFVVVSSPYWCVFRFRMGMHLTQPCSSSFSSCLIEEAPARSSQCRSPIRLRVEIPVPMDSYPPMPTPVKPFKVPPGSPAATQSKSKILSLTVCPSKF